MFVVTVEFEIKPPHRDAFMKEMSANATASVAREPGCKQFDVCVALDDPNKVFLYELYDDKRAFEAHLATPHFKDFDTQTGSWVARKTARFLTRHVP